MTWDLETIRYTLTLSPGDPATGYKFQGGVWHDSQGQVWGALLNIVRGGEAGGDSGVLPGKMWGHAMEVWAAVGATDVYSDGVFKT